MDWNAKWIWDGGEEKPKNYWLRFRKIFMLDNKVTDSSIYITADSRYILYINGTRVGAGPVRSWPFQLSYDTYEVSSLLKKGINTISVLVHHYGISTFQYIEGRGGLIVQLEGKFINGNYFSVISDGDWKCSVHKGYGITSSRICCQQPWAEIYDAGYEHDNWVSCGYNDHNWEHCIELGNAGIEPWNELKPSDIPELREDIIYPERIESISKVKRKADFMIVNLRSNFYPGDTDANPKVFLGYICSIIHSDCDRDADIYFPWADGGSCVGNFKINNCKYEFIEGQYTVPIKLSKGDNFFIMQVSGWYHELSTHIGITHYDDIYFKAPDSSDGKFITVGPFESNTVLKIGKKMNNDIDQNNAEYINFMNIKSVEDLKDYCKYVKTVQDEDISYNDVYADTVFGVKEKSLNVDNDVQNMIIPNNSCTVINPDLNSDTEFIIDFGKELTGFMEFDIDAEAGAVLDLYGVECINNGMMENTEGLQNTMRYIACDGRQRYRSVIRRGFRYIIMTVRNITKPLKINRIFMNLSTFAVIDSGRFKCSDDKINKIWEISKHTTRLCMEDTFVDCPAYEQTFWVGDSRNEALINYYTFGAYKLSKRCMEMVPLSMFRTKIPESQVPSGWQNVLTAWTLFWIDACEEYYEYTADSDFAEYIFPYLWKTIMNFKDYFNNNGLLEIESWNMLEWAPMDTPDKGVVTHQNAELYAAIKNTSYIADALHKHKQKEELLRIANNLKYAINKYLWSDEKKAYYDCIHDDGSYSETFSMQTNIMVYLSGCAEGDRMNALKSYLTNPPDGFIKIGSPFMSFFYLEALYKAGYAQPALDYIRDKWGDMLDYDATTCWETFKGYTKGRLTRSHCHAWSAAPGFFLSAKVLGIEPNDNGFKKVNININESGLEWAKGSVPIPDGRIDVEWEKTDEGILLNVNAPTEITINVEDDNVKKFNLNGRSMF